MKRRAEPGLWLEDVPVPDCASHEVRIRVRYASLCGTDLHIVSWDQWAQANVRVPRIIGHELMGTIEAVGDQVAEHRVGERVSVEGHVVCGHCRNCRAGRRHLCQSAVGIGIGRDGAFAERVVVPESNVFVLPDAVPDRLGSCFDPLGNAVHTALSFDLHGEDVLITGAGPIGLMACALCRFVGARHVVVTDLNEYRLALAREMGATRAVDPRAEPLDGVMRELGMHEGFDVGLEMSGNGEALREMLRLMIHGGHVALLGIGGGEIPTDWNQVIFKGLQLKGIYGREMYETWYKMTTLLQAGLDVSKVITHTFPAGRFAEAFDLVRSGSCGKVLLDWTDWTDWTA